MGEKPPEREGWTKVTDKKEAHRRSIELVKKRDEQYKQYALEEQRRNTTLYRCSDCEDEDNFDENFCPCCGKRLEPEKEEK